MKFYHHMNPRVYALKLTPGMNPAVLKTIFEEYDCIVVESFGVGGMPDSIIEDFCDLMKQYTGLQGGHYDNSGDLRGQQSFHL